ncbi:hypothetical protein CHU98_g10421 [Xylaria longipes]|nr:hypothetical protein CHU98_g10421 [Xylaria longipes]
MHLQAAWDMDKTSPSPSGSTHSTVLGEYVGSGVHDVSSPRTWLATYISTFKPGVVKNALPSWLHPTTRRGMYLPEALLGAPSGALAHAPLSTTPVGDGSRFPLGDPFFRSQKSQDRPQRYYLVLRYIPTYVLCLWGPLGKGPPTHGPTAAVHTSPHTGVTRGTSFYATTSPKRYHGLLLVENGPRWDSSLSHVRLFNATPARVASRPFLSQLLLLCSGSPLPTSHHQQSGPLPLSTTPFRHPVHGPSTLLILTTFALAPTLPLLAAHPSSVNAYLSSSVPPSPCLSS